jgi:5-methylcytosine-specific restriction endonuclease McrA
MMDALALNRAGIPVDVLPWKKAVTLWALGRAEVLEVYEGCFVHSPRLTLPLPSVLQCLDGPMSPRNFTRVLPFTRRNLYRRDGGCCAYCGQRVSYASFTIDHVHPRSLGGETTWENTVSACMPCNSRKGNRRPRGDLEPLQRPFVPRLTHAAPRNLVDKLCFRETPEAWHSHIYWSILGRNGGRADWKSEAVGIGAPGRR